jgi:hypothetical protein
MEGRKATSLEALKNEEEDERSDNETDRNVKGRAGQNVRAPVYGSLLQKNVLP